jgi:hypothetical protein
MGFGRRSGVSSDVREELSVVDLVSELLMMRTAFGGVFLLLEGEDDRRVLENFLESNDCLAYACDGKENVITALDQARFAGIVGVVGIVDADFWHFASDRPPDDDLLATDVHDMELLIFKSRAFDRVVREVCSRGKIAAYLKGAEVRSLRRALLRIAAPIGATR